MIPGDWVRLLNLLGSVVLFWASWRGQVWAKTQATAEERAVASRPAAAEKDPDQPRSDRENAQEFDRVARDTASRPYFDRQAYLLLCIGFAITTVAAALDLYFAGTVGRLMAAFG